MTTAPTRHSHSPSIRVPSKIFCVLPFELVLGSKRRHSPTLTADKKRRGPPPPTAWKYVWLPTAVDTLTGSVRERFRKFARPEKVRASYNNLNERWVCLGPVEKPTTNGHRVEGMDIYLLLTPGTSSSIPE